MYVFISISGQDKKMVLQTIEQLKEGCEIVDLGNANGSTRIGIERNVQVPYV